MTNKISRIKKKLGPSEGHRATAGGPPSQLETHTHMPFRGAALTHLCAPWKTCLLVHHIPPTMHVNVVHLNSSTE